MAYVKVRNNNIDKALEIFSSKVKKEGIMERYMEKQYYTKPSEYRREKVKARKLG